MAVGNQTTGIISSSSTAGCHRRGLIGQSGFSTTLIENQERGPKYFQEMVRTYDAVPGVVSINRSRITRPFTIIFDARGILMFNAAKFIDFQFGYDKNFIGNGYRSLF